MFEVPPLESRRARLAPLSAHFIDQLFHLACAGRIPWEWHSGVETPESFTHSLWSGVLAQFAIEERRSGRQVGLVRAYGGNAVHGYAYVTVILLPEYRMKAWPLEGGLLFANYLFMKYNLRNLYAEAAAHHFAQFGSGTGRLFEVEAHFRGRLMVNSGPEDLYVMRVSRERWLERGVELLRWFAIDQPEVRGDAPRLVRVATSS
jgi:hypothetical protein